MQTNMIPITKVHPIFSGEYVIELIKRIGIQLPNLPPEGRNVFLCDLLNAKKVEDLIDDEHFISNYEVQPALSSEELELLATRVLGHLPNENNGSALKQSKIVVRNVLNTIPKRIDDLVDYIDDSLLQSINFSFLLMDLENPPTTMPEAKLYLDEIDKLSQTEIDVSGSLCMQMFLDAQFNKLPGETARQKMLSRASEYYILHRYGYKTSSLWLAEFLAPAKFCTCADVDCGMRHFGFCDPKGAVELVLASLPFIEESIEDSDVRVVLHKNITVDDINASNVERVLHAVEAEMILDQGRVNAEKIVLLLRFIYEYLEVLTPMANVRLPKITKAYSDLYENGSELLGVSDAKMESDIVSSIQLLQSISDEPGYTPSSEEFMLHDAHNFFVYGYKEGGLSHGIDVHSQFIKMFYCAKSYAEFNNFVRSRVGSETFNEKTLGFSLFKGYVKNLTWNFCLRTIFTQSHDEEILNLASEFDLDNVINFLSESGNCEAMIIRRDKASSEKEKRYWNARITSD